MDDEYSGAYLYYRNGTPGKKRAPRKKRNHRKAAAALIAVLLLLSAAICLLVFFLPKLSAGVSGTPAVAEKTFYMLYTAEETERLRATEQAKLCSDRGGAGYIYNDGKYKIIAGVYSSEADAKALASVNDGAAYFSLGVSSAGRGDNSAAAIKYFAGEWFNAVDKAVTELDRGSITEAAAEHAVFAAMKRLYALLSSAEDGALKAAANGLILSAAAAPGGVLSGLRYVQAQTVAGICGS